VLGTIKTITPTFVLPHQGEGIKALPPVGFFMSRPTARPKIFEEAHEGHQVGKRIIPSWSSYNDASKFARLAQNVSVSHCNT
jgi:hypothetical protein